MHSSHGSMPGARGSGLKYVEKLAHAYGAGFLAGWKPLEGLEKLPDDHRRWNLAARLFVDFAFEQGHEIVPARA